MTFGFLRRSANRKLIDRLHGEIVAAARDPVLFTDYGIEDTFEGRFDSVTLHATLVLRRLRLLPAPAPEIAQELTDALFRHFDIALREMGVGDVSIPKRMKTLAEAFLGRSKAYDEALRQDGAAIEAALSRNIYASRRGARRLARYVEAIDAALAAAPLHDFLTGSAAFPRPSSISDSEEALR
jgi:cytochrome b pre-mRNA-processing protein 3